MRTCFIALTLFAASCGVKNSDAAAPAPMNAGEARGAAATALPPGVFHVQPVKIIDASGFDRPLVASTVLIPAGWTSEGAIRWNTLGQCGADYTTVFEARSPDGSRRLRVIPASRWDMSRSAMTPPQPSSCEAASYASVRDFLAASAARLFPGARMIDYRDLNDEVRSMRELMAQFPPTSTDTLRNTMAMEAGEALVAYQENGRDMRAAISASALITQSQMLDPASGQVVFESVQGSPSSLTVVSAPDGALDFGLRARVMKSVRFQGEWMAKISDYEREKRGVINKAMNDRHADVMAGLKRQAEISNGMYRDRDLASDRNQREFIESIRGVETYGDPVSNAPVQLDNTYDHAWRIRNVEGYIMTNDPNFNPGAYGLEADEMRPIQ